MDLGRNIIDCLNKCLVPLTNCTGEVGSSRASTEFNACLTVYKETGSTTPVVCGCSSAADEVRNDLTVDLKSNLLRENACKLNLCIKVVVSVKILS